MYVLRSFMFVAGSFLDFRLIVAASVLLVGFLAPVNARPLESKDYQLDIVTVATGLNNPWSVAWLPDGRMLVTEKIGRMRFIDRDGQLSGPFSGVPKVDFGGQGGLLDVAIDPEFSTNQTIFFTFSEPGDRGRGTAVARARLVGMKLLDVRVIWRQFPKSGGRIHFGSRIVIAPDGNLFISVGERGQRKRAQDTSVNRGQIIRIKKDGSIPADNPFVDQDGVLPEIWSYGHRNPQGAALHPQTGALWVHEHGARGGDEINISVAGKNYGWPIIAFGRHYSWRKIGVGTARAGLEQPIHYWDPSIAPSGMMFYTGDKFAKWQGNLFVGALGYRLLARLTLDGDKIIGEERLLKKLGVRIRDVRQGPDGYIYVVTDGRDGKILRLQPGK